MRVAMTLFLLVSAVSAVSGRGGARNVPFVLCSRKMASVFDYAPLLDHRTTSPGLVEASSNQPFAAPSSSWTTSSHSVPADSDVDFRSAILVLHARIDQQTKSSLESYMYLLSKTHRPTSDSSASPSSFRFTTAAAAAANVDAKIDDEEDNGIIEASSIGGDTKKSPCDILDQCGLAARTTGDGVLAIVYDDMGTPESKKGDSQITNIAGPRPLELAAHPSIQLLAKTIYLAGPLAHIQSKAKVVPTIISQNVARIVRTKNTIKMNKISDDESDIMIDDDAGLEEDLHGDGLISDSKDSTQIAQQDHDHADDIDTVTPPFVGVGGNSLTDRVTSHHLSPIAESIALTKQPWASSIDSTSIGGGGGGGRSFDAFIGADRSALQSRQHGVHDDSSSSASSLGDNGSTESSFYVVGGGISTSSSTPATTHHEMNGILDRLAFRPKSLAAQKRGLGEYKTAAISSLTAASARLGLRVLPVQHSSTPSSSKHGVGLSSAASTSFGSSSDGHGQYVNRRPASLELSPSEGVDLMMKLMDMGCLFSSGWIDNVHRLLKQLGSSRHLLRSDLVSALFIGIRHKIALELAQDTGIAENGGSIVLADDESGLVVTIRLRSGGFHLNNWRASSVGRKGVPAVAPARVMVDEGGASPEETLFSYQAETVCYPSLCRVQVAPIEGISAHAWAFFVLGLCLIALRFGLPFALSSEKVLWRHSAISWHRRLSPRGHWHRRRSPGITAKRIIYALPFLVVLVVEISAGSTGESNTAKTGQDSSERQPNSVSSFLFRVTSQLASLLPDCSSETTSLDMSFGPQATEVGIRGSTDNDDVAVDLLHEQSDDRASLSAVQLANPDFLPRKGPLTIRGSATSALSLAKPNSIAAQLQTIGEARLAMDQGLDELKLILTGDSDALKSISNTYGIQQQDVAQILEHINTETGLAQTVDDLNVIIRNEIQPMLASVYSMIEESLPETERRLQNIFERKSDMAGQTFAPSTAPVPSGHPSQHNKNDAHYTPPRGDGFQSYFTTSNSIREMMLRNGINVPGMPNHRPHRPQHGTSSTSSTGRNFHHTNRRVLSQDPPETCDKGCSDIEDDVNRKKCNCEDLFYCAKQLKDTDLAVLFSRGLVDANTGTIEVEEVDLDNERLWSAGQTNGGSLFDDNGNLKTQSNNVLDDLFDADQLLAKRNAIRGLVVQKKCDELLDEFHVPCRDWRDGCSGSDGRSYRLTIDEICEAIDSPELITFTSMSEAFDKEDSCDVNDYMPSEDDLLSHALSRARTVFDSSVDLDFNFLRHCLAATKDDKSSITESCNPFTDDGGDANSEAAGRMYTTIVNAMANKTEMVVKPRLEECYRNECKLDTKVGLQSCQEMIDCTIDIWEAGKEAGKSVNSAFPNPYPFSSSANPTTNQIYQVINSEWNSNIALGKTAIASSTHSVLAHYVNITNTGSSYLHLQEVVVMGYDENGELKNLALGKSATQSCPYRSDDPYPASLVVDGDISGQVSHTCSNQTNPWLQIDLGSIYQIESVTIINRDEDCCRDRLKDFYVRLLSDDPDTIVEEIYQEGVIGASKTYTLTVSDPFFAVDGKSNTSWRSASGDSNIVFSIDLGKVHKMTQINITWLEDLYPNDFYFVFSLRPSPPVLENFKAIQIDTNSLSNLALNKTATQSCQYNYTAGIEEEEKAERKATKDAGKIDFPYVCTEDGGNENILDHEDKQTDASFVTDGYKDDGFYSRTCRMSKPWLTIDLGSAKLIRTVRIYNRKSERECVRERLKDFSVRLYNIDPSGGIDRPVSGGVTYHIGADSEDSIDIDYGAGILAQYVKIQLEADNYLHLREVEVMGLDEIPDLFDPIHIQGVAGRESYNLTEELKRAPVPSRWMHVLATDGFGISDISVYSNSLETSKWDSIAWPSQWNLAQDKGGLITFLSPGGDDALLHRQQGALESSLVETSTLLQGNANFEHSFIVKKPRECGIDVKEDTRCDDTRSLLFGKSTSVGQICSIAEAVTTDPDTRERKLVPDNMPGTCCLDNMKTLKNFGQRYTCGQTCKRFAPYTLGMSAEACAQVGGTWCRRPCLRLKQCIENKPKRDKCRIAAKYEITADGIFDLTRTGYECDDSGDAVYLYISCKDEKGNNCSPPSQSTVVPSSMPSFSRSPSSSPTVLSSEDPILGSEAPILGSEEEIEEPIIGSEEETRDTTLGPSSSPVTDAPTRGPSSSPVTDAPTRGPNPVSLSNLALNKIATQKCDMMDLTANNAVDGQLNTFSHTGGDYDGCWNAPEGCCTHQAWWSVDLGELKNIQQIKIYNRLVDGGCPQWCQDRLRNFDISLYETNPEGGTPIVSEYRVDPIGDEFSFDFGGANARWVRIELRGHDYLHFREVEVLGLDIPPVTDAPNRGLISVEPEPEVPDVLVEPEPEPPMPGVPPPQQRSLFDYNSTASDPVQVPEPQINKNNSVPVLAGSDKMNSTYGQNVPSNASFFAADDPPSPAPFCQNKSFTFTFTIAFAKSAHGNAAKKITHFVKARNGIQTDLYSDIGSVFEVSNGNALVVTRTESMTLCSNDATAKNLIILDLENVDFNEAFDAWSIDLNIDDEYDEEQCQQTRQNLGYDEDYLDDFEICREFQDIKCEYDDNDLYRSNPKGGKIPGFQGFEFKQQTFDGFEFEGDEFEGFEFEGFEPSEGLTFDEVQKVQLEGPSDVQYDKKAIGAIKSTITTLSSYHEALKWTKELSKINCKIPMVCIAGFGTDAPCKGWESIMEVISKSFSFTQRGLETGIFALKTIVDELAGFGNGDHWKTHFWSEATYENLKTLSTALYSNLNILNENMRNQHGEVRSTLETQHGIMMDQLSSQHSEIGGQLTEQHNNIGTQLTEQHTSIGEQLTEQHNNIGNQMATQHTSLGEQLTEQHNAVGEQLTEQHNRIGKQLTEQHGVLQANLETFAEALGGTLTGDVGWSPGETPMDLLLHINATIAALAAMSNEEPPSRRLDSKPHSGGDTTATIADAIQALRSDIAIMSEKQADLESNIIGIKAALQLDETGKMDGQPLRSPSDIAANSERAIGLAVDVRCPPIMPEFSKSTSGMFTIDLLVNTQAYGKACEAHVAQATAIYAKDGNYKSQAGRLEPPMPVGAEGVQIVRILFDKESGELRNREDMTMLHIIALKEEQDGATYQKSVLFDYSACHQASMGRR